MDDKVILVESKVYEETVKAYKEIGLDATQTAYLFGAKPVLSVAQDLDLVRQGVKTRKPARYGKKVVVEK